MSEALIREWYELRRKIDENKLQMAATIVRELELRRQLITAVWPTPREGVNTYQLGEGYVLKGTYKLKRTVDAPALPPIIKILKESVNVDELVPFKPDLALKRYRELTDEQRKIMDQALIIRPEAPELEIVAPKKP